MHLGAAKYGVVLHLTGKCRIDFQILKNKTEGYRLDLLILSQCIAAVHREILV